LLARGGDRPADDRPHYGFLDLDEKGEFHGLEWGLFRERPDSVSAAPISKRKHLVCAFLLTSDGLTALAMDFHDEGAAEA
jgi:hypothetical protein